MLGNHLLGLYEKALDLADSWKTRLEKVKALGFDYMEISIDESDARLARLDWTAQQRRELREILLRRRSHSAVHVPQSVVSRSAAANRRSAARPIRSSIRLSVWRQTLACV
ncbi:MAG: hypothetical protein V8S99_08455 [Oscillospiraceae bacterium]